MAEVNRDDRNPDEPVQDTAIDLVIGLLIGSGQEVLRQRAREELTND